jgi:hypothetical protein
MEILCEQVACAHVNFSFKFCIFFNVLKMHLKIKEVYRFVQPRD